MFCMSVKDSYVLSVYKRPPSFVLTVNNPHALSILSESVNTTTMFDLSVNGSLRQRNKKIQMTLMHQNNSSFYTYF